VKKILTIIFMAIKVATSIAQTPLGYRIDVSIAQQQLCVKKNNKIIKTYPISTSGYGVGSKVNSNFTPLGKHTICAKIGAGAPIGTIFKAGIQTKRNATIHTNSVPNEKQEDFITTRVFQLQGEEAQNANSFSRGIWVHGTPYEGDIGRPCSHGCVRMKNKDIIELFELITLNTPLIIVAA
jgi:lipoprotein-anchoring transpeptidase ErfK/SrfK